ncbi:outer membrane receptor protein involved in Fe transport [Algoriphagus sp. 4150]|uniref:TonB-dependent receptor n=1 Tax=Algoriphagus sp. 4150 TaxID=2817756 RepID=UPI00285A3C78|nr:TonB-dependent receptor plug domain-containing protein [Algoriphagus sp. 4150]MDR7131451.1 outer membrane receptor protein involved in Fe transport [Algoriphagus sp. 4150]
MDQSVVKMSVFRAFVSTCLFLSSYAFVLAFPNVKDSVSDSLQTFSCSGVVYGDDGVTLPGAVVKVSQSDLSTVCDKNGYFSLSNIDPKDAVLIISFLGYKEKIQPLSFAETRHVQLEIVLDSDNHLLEQIEVSARSIERELAEQPILIQAVSTREVREQPSSLVDLLNRSAGIRIRQTGAVGARSNVLMNGFQNRSVRYFKDEIPMDYLGGGFDLSLLPINMIERVEVYKGALPGKLGADALGGALNFVSREAYRKELDVSYEIGSFQTHRAALSGFFKNDTSPYFVGLDAFYNNAANNYPVEVRITDQETGTQYDDEVKLFHNRFRNFYTEVYGGIANRSWTKELRIGLTVFQIDRQINYGASMHQAIGAATNRQHSVIPTLRYRHTALNGRLDIDHFMVANTIHVQQLDTARGQYNWYGEFFPSDSRLGELNVRGSMANLDYSYRTSRTYLGYALSEQHRLEFNTVFSGFSRVGRDPMGPVFSDTREDVLSTKGVYNKTAVSLGVTSNFIEGKLSNQLTVKYYNYKANATDADYQGRAVHHDQQGQDWGIAEALKLTLSDQSFVRISGEVALRMPEQDELFGDGDRKLPNLSLKPERSLNLNAGYRLNSRKGHFFEFNTFYRLTEDLILLVPHNLLFSQSKNMEEVRGFGIEADGSVMLSSWLRGGGNFTVQELRHYNTNAPSMEKSRLRNTPYFFSNLFLQGDFQNLLGKEDKLQVYWYFQFVRQYYLDAVPRNMEPQGFLGLWGEAQLDVRNIIPDQSIHTLGFTYHPFGRDFSLGMQVRNLLDKPAFDQFRIQNAGRSYHLKVLYHLSKK